MLSAYVTRGDRRKQTAPFEAFADAFRHRLEVAGGDGTFGACLGRSPSCDGVLMSEYDARQLRAMAHQVDAYNSLR